MTDERALKIALSALHEKRRLLSGAGTTSMDVTDAIFVLEGLHTLSKDFGGDLFGGPR